MASEHVHIGDATDNLNLNAPYTIIETHFVLSIVAMFAVVAFVAVPLTRDIELKTAGNVRRDRRRRDCRSCSAASAAASCSRC